jgi:hypothetical protein
MTMPTPRRKEGAISPVIGPWGNFFSLFSIRRGVLAEIAGTDHPCGLIVARLKFFLDKGDKAIGTLFQWDSAG